jgi:hypothetical protein
MKKILIYSVLALVLMPAIAAHADPQTDDAVTRELVSQWNQERDQIALQVVRNWLKGRSDAVIAEDVARLANTCMNIAITTRKAEPVLADLAEFESKPVGLLHVLLEREGIHLKAGDAFAGKTFRIYVRD